LIARKTRAATEWRAAHGNRPIFLDELIDFKQGLHLGDALQRCHMIDGEGLAWIEEPIVYDNLDGYAQLTGEIKTPIQ
jgi:mandelate racemase